MGTVPEATRRAGAVELLSAHVPADGREAAHLGACLALLAAPADPFSRRSFRPGHLTASAFVLSPARDALLLIRHPTLQRWLQPGGHVEPADATLEDAARREALEETGIDGLVPAGLDGALLDVDVHPIPARGDEPGHAHHDVRFAFVAPDRALPAGHLAASWVALDRVADLADDPALRRVVAKLDPIGGSPP